MLHDLKLAVVFLTRLQLRLEGRRVGIGDLASVVHFFPVVGLLVGATGAVVYLAASFAHLPSLPAVVLTLGAMALLTGALHEDGLADTADALGALPDRDRALEIMRDSRIGSFGAIALILVMTGKLAAIAGFWDGYRAAAAVIAAAAFSRAVMPVVMYLQPSARGRGLAAEAGRPPVERVLAALAIGIAAAIVLLPAGQALTAVLVAAAAAAITAWALGRAFGGCTGDTLGAVQQLTELAFLFALVTWR
jgi:adenosylcobinamide-GDP ribazoletransferase